MSAEATVFLWFAAIAVPVVLILLPFISSSNKQQNIDNKEQNTQKKSTSQNSQIAIKKYYNMDDVKFPKGYDGQKLYKVYDEIDICVITNNRPDYTSLRIGGELSFKQEPENKFDDKAVAVYQDNKRIGYLYRGTGQDMTNDFINRGDIVTAVLTYIDSKNDILKMTIAYYRS